MYTTIFNSILLLIPFVVWSLDTPTGPCRKSSRCWHLFRFIIFAIIIKQHCSPADMLLFFLVHTIIAVAFTFGFDNDDDFFIEKHSWLYLIEEIGLFIAIEYLLSGRAANQLLSPSVFIFIACCILTGVLVACLETFLYPDSYQVNKFLEKSSNHFPTEEFIKYWDSCKNKVRGISLHTILTSIISILIFSIIRSMVG